MLRQNFLSKLLDLSKSSRVFLLLFTVTCCSYSEVQSKRTFQTAYENIKSVAGLPSSQKASNLSYVMRVVNPDLMSAYDQDSSDEHDECRVEYRKDGIYDVYYKNGIKIWECGPRTGD